MLLSDHDTNSSISASLLLLYAAICLIIHKGKMSTVFSGQNTAEPSPPPSQADDEMVEQFDALRLAPSGPKAEQKEPRTQPTEQKTHQRSASMPSQNQGGRSNRRRPSQQQHRFLAPMPSLSIFHPRSFEEIYAEQAYLSLTLQSLTSRLCDLVYTYHKVEEESMHGECRKLKRRARRQVGMLRSQIKQASEQEKNIFARLGDLLIEAKSREAFDLVTQHSTRPCVNRSGRGDARPARSPGPSTHLNGATAEFIPRRKPRDQRTDSGVGVFLESEDEEGERAEDTEFELRPRAPDESPDEILGAEPRLRKPRHPAPGDLDLGALMLRRQASMPNISTPFLAQ